LLTIADVAIDDGAVAVEEHHHDGRTARIETGRNVQQDAVVAERPRFPQSLAAEGHVTAAALCTGIEKRPSRTRHHAAVGKRRVLEINKLGQPPDVRWNA